MKMLDAFQPESHSLPAFFFQKERTRAISIVRALGCQNTPQIQLRHLQGDFRTYCNQKNFKPVVL